MKHEDRKLFPLLILFVACLVNEDTNANILFKEGKKLEQELLFDSAAITYLKAASLSKEEGIAPQYAGFAVGRGQYVPIHGLFCPGGYHGGTTEV